MPKRILPERLLNSQNPINFKKVGFLLDNAIPLPPPPPPPKKICFFMFYASYQLYIAKNVL
jgi:hypothetical protein